MNKQSIHFGKYVLQERLAMGGSSEVWRATMGPTASPCVVKRLHKTLSEEAAFSSLFIQEAQVLLRLNHTNISQLFEFGSADGHLFVAMEYVPGKSLDSVVRHFRKNGGTLPIALGCCLVAQAGRGLDFAHRLEDSAGRLLGFVHRSVEPEHVLIAHDGVVKLIGWADAQLPGNYPTAVAPPLRTKLSYLSPEYLNGTRDHRSDVFQLGLCLYVVLTGTRALAGDTDMAVVVNLRDGIISPPRQHNPAIPEALEAVVLKALANNVDDRYQRASEFSDALKPFSADAAELADFMRRTFPTGATSEATAPSELLKQLERKWGV